MIKWLIMGLIKTLSDSSVNSAVTTLVGSETPTVPGGNETE